MVKDLIARRLADGGALEFEVSDTAVAGLDTGAPVLSYTASDGQRHEITCDVIAGCDGFHGICRPAIPDRLRTVWERDYPYAWLGILAEAPPATDELIYAHHRRRLRPVQHAQPAGQQAVPAGGSRRAGRGLAGGSGSGRRCRSGSRCPAGR